MARLRGSGASGRKPILLLAHLDVVAARREDWTIDPFTFTEKDGYYYGRGTSDDKAMAAIWIANMIRMKQEGFVPDSAQQRAVERLQACHDALHRDGAASGVYLWGPVGRGKTWLINTANGVAAQAVRYENQITNCKALKPKFLGIF